jgi:hypothetical protein
MWRPCCHISTDACGGSSTQPRTILSVVHTQSRLLVAAPLAGMQAVNPHPTRLSRLQKPPITAHAYDTGTQPGSPPNRIDCPAGGVLRQPDNEARSAACWTTACQAQARRRGNQKRLDQASAVRREQATSVRPLQVRAQAEQILEVAGSHRACPPHAAAGRVPHRRGKLLLLQAVPLGQPTAK